MAGMNSRFRTRFDHESRFISTFETSDTIMPVSDLLPSSQEKILDPMHLGRCQLRPPSQIFDQDFPAPLEKHPLQDLFGKVHIIMDHGVTEPYGGTQFLIERILQDPTLVQERNGIPSALGNDRTIMVFQNPAGLADAIFDDDLQRASGRPSLQQRKFTPFRQLRQQRPFPLGGRFAGLQGIVKIHLFLL